MSGEPVTKTQDSHWNTHMQQSAPSLSRHDAEQVRWDVTFLVGSGISQAVKMFKCDKVSLAMVSPMFEAMFYGTFPQTEDIIRIPDVTPEAFQHMMCYAYGESVIKLDGKCLDDALDTLYCAKKYLIEKLECICRDHIQLHVTALGTDACLVFQRAKQLDEEGVTSLALARIALAASHIMESDAFLRLSLECLQQIVDYAHLSATEPQIYQGVRRWLKHNVGGVAGNALRDAMGSLLYSIRFPLFSATELTNGPLTDGALLDEEASRLLQLIMATDVQPPMSFLTTPRLPLPLPLPGYFDLMYPPHTRPRGRLLLLNAQPDLAPQCCTLLRHLIEDKLHIRIVSYDNEHADRPVQFPATLLADSNFLAHSIKGACWFEWDVEGNTARNVRIGLGRKPHLHHSDVFGFMLSLSDNQWVPLDAWDDQRVRRIADFRIGRRERFHRE